MKVTVLLLVLGVALLAVFAAAGPVEEHQPQPQQSTDNTVSGSDRSQLEEALTRKLNAKCAQRDASSCVMLKLVTYMNRMLKKSSIELSSGIEITQTTAQIQEEDVASTSRNFNSLSEDGQLSELIADKLWNFVRTRSLRWKIIDEADLVVSPTTDKDGSLNLGISLHSGKQEEEGRGKKNNGMGAVVAAAVLKLGLLKALAFKGLVMLVGKALLVSKLALVLAAVIGLKKLFSQEKHVTYEVVAHPHHSHEHSSGGHDSYSSGWGRSLAYRAHDPANASH